MAEWFRHDMDALLDAKIQELVTRCGMAGYGLYWTIVERMYRNNGAVAGADLALLERLTGTAHKTFLRYLQAFVEIGLFSTNNGEYHSPRIDMELDRVKELNAKRAEGAKKRQDDLRQAVDKHCSSTGCAGASEIAQAVDDHCSSTAYPIDSSSRDETKRYDTRDIDSLRSSCSEPCKTASEPDPGSEAIEEIPTNRYGSVGEVFRVTQEFLDELQEAYPAVDVKAELKRLRSWSLANGSKRKTLGGMPRFINAWMAKTQDRTGMPERRASGGSALPDSVIHTEEAWAGIKGGQLFVGGAK